MAIETRRQTGITFDDEVVEDFRTTLCGNLLLPGDAGFDESRTLWNGMIDRQPALIIQPTGVADVISAVSFAREHDLLVSIKGGGHNVAGAAVCDDGLMIDLSQMRSVRVDPDARVAYVEGGATWREFDHETAHFNLASVGGAVSTTGVAGLTLGGGIGWLTGKFGMACDNVRSFDIVLADGRFVRANAEQHPDLYWALRGGGGNFGVVTGFEFDVHPLNSQVLAGPIMYPIEQTAEVLAFYRDFAKNASDDLTVIFPTLMEPESGANVCVVAACHAGPMDEAERELAPLRAFGTPIVDAIQPIPYEILQQAFDPFFPHGRNYYWKSVMVEEISDEIMEVYTRFAVERPTDFSYAAFEHYHGKFFEVAPGETAFWHRNARHQILIAAVWSDPGDEAACMRWAREFHDAIAPHTINAPFLNFAALDQAERAERVKAGFGGNYERLVEVKNRYDPTNFFRVNNNIRPTA